MASRSWSIADAYVAWLNDSARGWSTIGPGWVAERVNVPRADLAALGNTLLAEVIPPLQSIDGGLIDRDRRQLDWLVGLSLRQHYDEAASEPNGDWLDARVALAESIARATREITPLASQPAGYYVWVEAVQIDPIYDLAALDEFLLFSSQMVVTFREAGPR